MLDELEEGNPVPQATKYEDVKPRDNGQVNMLMLDMESYAEQYGENSVRKNVTIPAWLNTFAEKQKINFSKVLQEALISRATKK